MTKHTRITSSEITRAKEAAAEAGLCLTGLEKRPDGTVRLEFAPPQPFDNDWRDGSPLYKAQQ